MPQPKHQTEIKHVFAFFLAIIALLLLMSWNDSRPTYTPKSKPTGHYGASAQQ